LALPTWLPQLHYLANKIVNCKRKLKTTVYIKTVTLDADIYSI